MYRHQVHEKIITIEHLAPLTEHLFSTDFLLIGTGWDRYWGDEKYFGDFPVLEVETARWLTTNFQLKGIGLDVISADPIDSLDFPVHLTILGKGMVIVENLKDITKIPVNSCFFSCLPLKLPEADGSPVRAVAIIEENAEGISK